MLAAVRITCPRPLCCAASGQWLGSILAAAAFASGAAGLTRNRALVTPEMERHNPAPFCSIFPRRGKYVRSRPGSPTCRST